MTEAERIYRARLAEALEAARKGEGELAAAYKRISGRIKARVSKSLDDVTVFAIQREIDAAFEAEFAKRVGAVERAIASGRGPARSAARETLERATRGVAKAKVNASLETVQAASVRLAERTNARPYVPVSSRIRRWDQDLGAAMAREIDAGIKEGRGILGAAKKIQAVDVGFDARLPQYLQEVERAARAGAIPELKALTSGYLKHVKEKLGEIQPDGSLRASAYSLRGPTSRFLRDIEKARGEGIDKVVTRYVEDRAQYQARLIARHETVEAYREQYIRETRDKPGVVGYRWTLSGRHPRPDECDLFANQNAFDMGPGVYPPDEIPRRHPACICSISAVTDADVANGAAPKADTSSPGAVEWMKRNEGLAEKILGPTRWAAFKDGQNVLDATGKPLLVRDLGRPSIRAVKAPRGSGQVTVRAPSIRPAARKSVPPPKPKRLPG